MRVLRISRIKIKSLLKVTQRRISTILQVMDMLQEEKINNFSLVTGLRGKDFNKRH
jgi:CTP:phosphocholine cytidylyltransferase-like protein